jgi:HAD superfamily hydrolase (TIGR01490 family)
VKLAIFDLDNTLIAGDSDHLWGEFLIEQGVVEREHYRRENDRFLQEYRNGTLDIHEFLRFSLRPLSEHPLSRLQTWHEQFMREKIEPIMLPAAARLLEQHRRDGAVLLIITATNRFVTTPIAQRLGVDELLATEPEFRDGRYTGEVIDPPCFRDGKVTRLEQWLHEQGLNLAQSWFYSDSHNDLPLLELVNHPVAVDPDDTLRQHADMRGWPVISLRDGQST